MASTFCLLSFPCNATRLLPCRATQSRSRSRGIIMAQASVAAPARRSANYPPTLWDNTYIQSLRIDPMEYETTEIQRLEAYVKRLIDEEKENLVSILELIDTLSQLGVAYHFVKEIKDVLGTIYESADDHKIKSMEISDNLYATSLLFRLLRDHGYNVSQDIFNDFMDENGKFKAYLLDDTKGMISLYEASYLAKEGDYTLEEARNFTTKHLKDLEEANLDPCLRGHVAHALDLPLNWRVSRLHARWFIDAYMKSENMDNNILELAKLDFNKVQSIYKKELQEESRWWCNLGIREKLNFMRDRLTENYLWAVGWTFEPQFGNCRKTITQLISLVTMVDDIYDVYGTLDELELFTEVVDRWDVNAMEGLPEYMKISFLALFNATNETANEILKAKGVEAISYLRKPWADLCKGYLEEAKWYYSGYRPSLKEYLNNSWFTISGPLMMIYMYFWVTQNITEESLKYLETYPDFIRRSSMIFRLADDLGTSTDELKRGDVPKVIQCYMYDEGVSEEVAREYVMGMINDIWKEMNEHRISCTSFEESFIIAVMNVPRMAQWFYQHGDGYGSPEDEINDWVKSMLIEPI